MTDIESIKARLRCDADTADMTQSLAQVLPKDIRALLDRVGELERKLAEAERGHLDAVALNPRLSGQVMSLCIERDAANERNAKLERAIQGLLNKVNRVTVTWRHQEKVNANDMWALVDRQITTESALAAAKEDGGA